MMIESIGEILRRTTMPELLKRMQEYQRDKAAGAPDRKSKKPVYKPSDTR